MNNKFDKRLKNVSQQIWLKISELETLRGRWDGSTKLNHHILNRLKKSVLITSTGSSTRIEGSKLSDKEIEKLIKGIAIVKFATRDKQEAKGYYELLSNVFSSSKTLKFSESLIKHFHQELLKYVEKDTTHRGDYKKKENTVQMVDKDGKVLGVLFATTKAYLTPKEMTELVDWTTNSLRRKTTHPILVIANFIVEFLSIHPFTDGNGRLSRILTNLLLLEQGYLYMPYISHEKIIEDNKPEYYLALRQTQKTIRKIKTDLNPWLNFFLDTLLTQSKQAISLFSMENVESTLSPSQQRVWQYLGSVISVSPRKISQATNIPRPTINQIANKLISLKLIERFGLGSATKYRKK